MFTCVTSGFSMKNTPGLGVVRYVIGPPANAGPLGHEPNAFSIVRRMAFASKSPETPSIMLFGW
jgi:hypothetical protein